MLKIQSTNSTVVSIGLKYGIVYNDTLVAWKLPKELAFQISMNKDHLEDLLVGRKHPKQFIKII